MQESFVGAWAEGSQLSGACLHSMRDLNHRFLELAATARGEWACGGGLAGSIGGRVAPCGSRSRAVLAAGAGSQRWLHRFLEISDLAANP